MKIRIEKTEKINMTVVFIYNVENRSLYVFG